MRGHQGALCRALGNSREQEVPARAEREAMGRGQGLREGRSGRGSIGEVGRWLGHPGGSWEPCGHPRACFSLARLHDCSVQVGAEVNFVRIRHSPTDPD